MKDARYFFHDVDASQDPKMLLLRARWGWAGVGMYWRLIEALRASGDFTYPLAPVVVGLMLQIEETEADQFLAFLFEIKLTEKTENLENFFSPALTQRMEKLEAIRTRYSEAGKKGGQKRALASNAQASLEHRLSDASTSLEHPSSDPQAYMYLSTNISTNTSPSEIKISSGEKKSPGAISSPPKSNKVSYAERITMTPSDFEALIVKYGKAEVLTELQGASDWLLAKGRVWKDGAAGMRNWMKKATAFKNRNGNRLSSQTSRQQRETEAVRAFLHSTETKEGL